MAEQQREKPRSDYWNGRIRKWAATSYTQKRDDFFSQVRSSIDARKVEAKKLLSQYMEPGYTLIDLGCGAGQFAIETVRDCGAKNAIGRDFSKDGIELANQLRDEMKVPADQVQFEVGSVTDAWPDTDVVTGLGLLDWLDEDVIDGFFSNLKGKKFVLSFSEQDWSFAELVHRFYLVYPLQFFGKGVRVYHHKRSFMLGLAEKYNLGKVELVSSKGMRFGRLIHNLGSDQ